MNKGLAFYLVRNLDDVMNNVTNNVMNAIHHVNSSHFKTAVYQPGRAYRCCCWCEDCVARINAVLEKPIQYI